MSNAEYKELINFFNYAFEITQSDFDGVPHFHLKLLSLHFI